MIIKRDFKRIFMSIEIFLGVVLFFLIALFLSTLISSGTKFGISIFGNLTIFSNGKIIILNGLDYTKGFGVMLAILISLFIGKEYRYKTFGYLISKDISRSKIYFSKLISSILIGNFLFIIYECTSFIILSITGISGLSLREFAILLIQGVLIYSGISSIICFISMGIKNYIFSLILSIMFIFLENNIVIGIGKIMNLLNLDSFFYNISKYSLFGMSEVIKNTQINFNINILIGSIVLMTISSLIGIINFNRNEI